MCNNKDVVYEEGLLWMSGTSHLRRLFGGGGYMLHHIHCREFTQQGRKQLGLLIFITSFDSQFCFYPQHTPYPKPAVKENKSFFPLFVLRLSLLKVSQRTMCLERDVYCLYVVQCLNHLN